jgi:transcriptional regulator with XRE-family HTH domain
MLAMSDAPSLSLALRWLITDSGLSEQELAVSSGVSPGAVAAFLSKPSPATLTWLHLLAGLRCRVEVKAPRRFLVVAMPKPSAMRRTHERQQWEARRLTAFRSQLLRQSPGISPAEAHATAKGYVAASASRLAGDLAAAQARLEGTRIDQTAPGMRAAVRLVAQQAAVNAEDLSLLAGVSLGAAQAGLDPVATDGMLATPHRLFSAIAARLVILPAGGGAVTIDLAPPGTWRPEAPRPGRTSLSHDDIRSRAADGESLASIARDAGVSRQRVHVIVRGVG